MVSLSSPYVHDAWSQEPKIVYLLMLLSFFSNNCFENVFLPFWFSATFIFTKLKKLKTSTNNSVTMRPSSFFHYYYTFLILSLSTPILQWMLAGGRLGYITAMTVLIRNENPHFSMVLYNEIYYASPILQKAMHAHTSSYLLLYLNLIICLQETIMTFF